jgi:ABC-type uncharacterized transport system ATPase subunit
MKNVLVINSSKQKMEIVSFSGKRDDIYQLIGNGVEVLEDIIVGNKSNKKYHILIDPQSVNGILPSSVKVGGIPIQMNRNVVVCSMTDDMTEFTDMDKSDMVDFEKLVEFMN